MSDETGTVVWSAHYRDPFGGPVQATDPDQDGARVSEPVRLPGQYDGAYFAWIGEAGPYDNWHRTYSPRIGRYLSFDPRQLRPTSAADSMEPFGYALGAPIVRFDISGLASRTWWGWRIDSHFTERRCICYLKGEVLGDGGCAGGGVKRRECWRKEAFGEADTPMEECEATCLANSGSIGNDPSSRGFADIECSDVPYGVNWNRRWR